MGQSRVVYFGRTSDSLISVTTNFFVLAQELVREMVMFGYCHSVIHYLLFQFFQLARLEPGSISFELFATFCDPANDDHDLEKLKFLCLLRKSGGL